MKVGRYNKKKTEQTLENVAYYTFYKFKKRNSCATLILQCNEYITLDYLYPEYILH